MWSAIWPLEPVHGVDRWSCAGAAEYRALKLELGISFVMGVRENNHCESLVQSRCGKTRNQKSDPRTFLK